MSEPSFRSGFGNLQRAPSRLPSEDINETGVQMNSEQDFSEYVASRWPRLVRTAVLMGCTEPEAEDVTQAALEKCFKHWHKVEQADDRDAYVHRILINTFVSSRRRHRWKAETSVADVPDQFHPDQTETVDQADQVHRSLMRLPPDQRAAVVLRYYAHLTERQMVDVLNVASGTVKSRLARGLNTLSHDPALTDLRGTR